MTCLLIHDPDHAETATAATVFGGRPSAPHGLLEWPVCRTCTGFMQFLGQLRLPASDELLLLFMCQNEPGLCDDWDADSGGNRVLAVAAAQLQLVQPPTQSETALRPACYGAMLAEQPEEDYPAAKAAWAAATGRAPQEVLGQMGGTPAWMQEENVPVCDACGKPMQFVAQLEQGPDWQQEMNFGGGGCAYVFRCPRHAESAKMLWQC